MKLLAAKFERNLPLHHQISDYVRSLILSGELAPGCQLPSTETLANTWQTATRTAHLALVALEKEGLLVRRHGKGTFVLKRDARLTCVGIYHDHATFGKGKSLYLQSLNDALKTELDARGIEMDVWIDPRPANQRGVPWSEFVRAAEYRKFQAVIVPCPNLDLLRWQPKLPVPTAFAGAVPGLPNQVTYSHEEFVDLSLRALAEQGCRSVGLIPTVAINSGSDDRSQVGVRFYAHFLGRSRDLGLRIKNEWIPLASRAATTPGLSPEMYGYEQFAELWRQPERPEGLIVDDDVVARGVITALLERQVRVPEELKLVLSKNEGIDLLCPMPATFMVSSERERAQALVELVEKQFRGERCEPIILSFRVIASGGSCGK